jgi:hypothetical protein
MVLFGPWFGRDMFHPPSVDRLSRDLRETGWASFGRAPRCSGKPPTRSGRVILDFPVSYGFSDTDGLLCGSDPSMEARTGCVVVWNAPGANMTNWRACGFSIPGHRDGTGTNPAIAPAMVAASILGRRQKWLLCRHRATAFPTSLSCRQT